MFRRPQTKPSAPFNQPTRRFDFLEHTTGRYPDRSSALLSKLHDGGCRWTRRSQNELLPRRLPGGYYQDLQSNGSGIGGHLIIYDAMAKSFVTPRQIVKKAHARIRKIHSRFITTDGTSMLLAYMHSQAAEAILEGNLEDARCQCLAAVQFQVVVWRDKPRSNYELLFINDQVRSDRGLISCLAKEIPCDCLNKKAKEIKANSIKTSFCSVCHKEVPFTSIFQCSR